MSEEEKKIVPKCKGGKQSYYSASGRWLPCCSFPDEGKILENSIFNRDEFLIKNSPDLQFHESDIFQLWLDRIEEDYDSAYIICKKRCSKKAHKVEEEVIRERVEALSSLADEMVSLRAQARIGETVRVLIEDSELQEGRAAHQGPEVDGTTSFIGTNFTVGQYVDAVVIDSMGADLVAEAR
jgi:hypothetical protein